MKAEASQQLLLLLLPFDDMSCHFSVGRLCCRRIRNYSYFCHLMMMSRKMGSESSTSDIKRNKAISLLKSERDPTRILSLCRSLLIHGKENDQLGSGRFDYRARSALSVAVSSLSSSQSHSYIRSLLQTMPTHHAIVLFGEANMIHDAISTFQQSLLQPHSSSTAAARSRSRSFNALLFACIVSDNHRLVPLLFRDYPSRYCIVPDLTTYNTLLKSFCQSGSSLSSYSVFDEMSQNKIKPNLTSFAVALAGFYREHRLDHVDRLLLFMKNKHGCHPGLSIYNIRIQSLCKLGRAKEAKQLLLKEMMRSKGMKPNCVTYGHLIFGFCSQGDLEEAKRLYREMVEERGLVPESTCYFTLIHYLCKGGDLDSALQVCKESIDRNWVPPHSMMRQLVDGLVRVSKTKEAREMIARVKHKFPSNAQMWTEIEQSLALL